MSAVAGANGNSLLSEAERREAREILGKAPLGITGVENARLRGVLAEQVISDDDLKIFRGLLEAPWPKEKSAVDTRIRPPKLTSPSPLTPENA